MDSVKEEHVPSKWRRRWRVRPAPIFLALTLGAMPKVALVQPTPAEQAALDSIAEFAQTMCTSIPITDEGQNVELSGTGKAELNALLSKIAEIGIEGSAKYQQSNYKNVLQADLARAIKNSDQCIL